MPEKVLFKHDLYIVTKELSFSSLKFTSMGKPSSIPVLYGEITISLDDETMQILLDKYHSTGTVATFGDGGIIDIVDEMKTIRDIKFLGDIP